MRFSPRVLDLACVAAIAAACAALWGPAIGIVSLNPDESQYEATASYLVATDTTPFIPYGAPGVFGVWALATRLFGPYPIHWMRGALLLGSLAIALSLFAAVRREAGRWGGLLAALVFAHYVLSFEGLTVNREWLASLCTLAGLGLFLRLETRDRLSAWAFAAAGFLCGMALWFKLQVSFMVLIAPAAMLARALLDRTTTRLVRTLPAFAAGGIASAVAYLVPYLLQGQLGWFLRFILFDTAVYVGGNEAAVGGDGAGAAFYLGRFLVGRYAPAVLLVSYLAALAVLGAWLARVAARGGRVCEWLTRPVPLTFAIYLPLSMVSVRLGHRFFGHYFQLMVPAIAALVGLAVAFLWRVVPERRAWQWGAAAVGVAIVAVRAATARTDPTWSEASAAAIGAGIVLVGGLIAVAAYWLPRPLTRATRGLALLIALEVGVLAVHAQLVPTPASMSHSPYRFDDLARFIRERAEPDDMLFVWGWAPEIYSLTRVTAASHVTHAQYVANDLQGVADRPSLDAGWAEILMSELRRTRPRFIVDASARSWHETEPWIYRLRNFPDFELLGMLRREYRRVGRFDGCDVWERVAPR